MRYNDLLRELEKKLGSKSTLYRKANLIKDELLISLKDAVYLLAFDEKINLERLLGQPENDRLRGIYFNYINKGKSVGTSSRISITSTPQKNAPKEKREIVLNVNELGNIARKIILPEQKFSDAYEMAKVYILLYTLENSIREVIALTMQKKYGSTWWDLKIQRKLKDKVIDRKKDEDINPWFGQERGSRQIDYLDLDELPEIIRVNEKDFVPDIFPSYPWIKEKVHDLYRSRCVVCHMNHLKKNNTDDVKAILRKWVDQTLPKKALIMP